MLVEGNTTPGGGLTGAHIPLPTTARRLHSGHRPKGFDWGAPAGPDPDAIARLQRQGILTVTEEVIDERAVKVVRKARRAKQKPGPKPGAITREATFDVDKAAQLYESGMSSRAVAKEVGVSAQTVRVRLAQAGVEMRGRESGNQKPRPRREPPFDVQEAIGLAREGWTTPELAERYGIGRKAIWRRLREAGHEFKVGGSKPRVDVDEVRRLHGQGMSQVAIARRLGFSDRAIRNHLTAEAS